jgi:hypothetical protein
MKAAIWVGAISIAIGERSSRSYLQALYSLIFQAIAIVFIVYALASCESYCVIV